LKAKLLGTFIIIFLLIVSLSVVQALQEAKIKVEVYRDGYAHVTHVIQVPEGELSIQTSLLGSPEFLLVTSGEGEPLDYELNDTTITVYALGAEEVIIEYDTADLTEKIAGVWFLKLTIGEKTEVLLPQDASIVYMSDIPEEIGSKDGKVYLLLGPGTWEIDYTLEPMPPTTSPTETPTSPPVTTETMPTSPSPTSPSPSPTTTETIETTETTTPTASPTTSPTAPVEFKPDMTTYLIIGAIIAIIAVISYVVISRRHSSASLDIREREIIDYLRKRGGKALESEIRRDLKLPKSTTNRLLKRLEEKGIVKIRKIGIQNEVSLM